MYPLETIELTKAYRRKSDGVEGIENASLKLPDSKIIAILGPNGSGKTTFIKMITCQTVPDKGKVLILGTPINQSVKESNFSIRRRIGYAPENPFFYGRLTGWEFARFMESIYDHPLDEGGILGFRSVVSAFALTPHLDKLVDAYSHGTLRKLILAFAIAFGTRIMVLDEPSNGLDPDSYLALRDILRECRTRGRSILLATHQLSMAQELADDIAIFHKGRMKSLLENDGSVESLFKQVVHGEA